MGFGESLSSGRDPNLREGDVIRDLRSQKTEVRSRKRTAILSSGLLKLLLGQLGFRQIRGGFKGGVEHRGATVAPAGLAVCKS